MSKGQNDLSDDGVTGPVKKNRHSKPKASKKIDGNLLGPCGIHCGYCLAFKRACLGCRYQADKKAEKGDDSFCPLLNCAEKKSVAECSDCEEFPCKEQYDPDNDGMYAWTYIRYLRDDIKPL